MTTTATQYEVGTIVHVAPGTLQMDRNIREAKPDKALADSIRAIGVQEPISAVITASGNLLVRLGHRRTLASIEAERETVPVYICGHDSDAKTDEIGRVIAQRDENTHRAGLTTAEEIGVVETLTGLGLSAAQVAKQARMKRTDVDNAIAVSGSALARKSADRYETLTLDQLVTVQEFEDDPETVKALIAAASEGKFAHVAQRARNDRAEQKQRADLIASLTEAGVRVIERDSDSPAKAVTNLKASKDSDYLTAETHTECPGHVAWLGTGWVRVDTATGEPVDFPAEPDDGDEAAWDAYEQAYEQVRQTSREVHRAVPVYGCENPTEYGHVDPWVSSQASRAKPKADEMTDEERAEAKAKRALVIENNKAWTAAKTVRREWLATFAARKTAPKGTATFIATALCRDSHLTGKGIGLAADWLGVKHSGFGRADLSPTAGTTEGRALTIALVEILGGYEDEATGDNAWRHDGRDNATGRYLRFLEAAGYGLSDVETYAQSSETA
ncbi:hypothetical protein GCM10011584_35280 [Nocardioides phosphati]|uniref:ParB/Sulfiredoxin domain-containing protein n=1 Tax=Nocardioides phosphati TaxID=1867775 RepID=A0ABQ2NE31_9ACTN|nr:ParB N-terminal domain-containing protein [Nocardioides phosphati]GGO94381.1 hypothetical protein GCM10011584_35280 [Nocardioides phosphati]